MKRNGSRSCVTRKTRFGSRERDWLKGDTQRGCVCLYGGTVDFQPSASGAQTSSTPQTDLQLVLCSTRTTVEELCAQRHEQGLYVQLHGDLIRWMFCVIGEARTGDAFFIKGPARNARSPSLNLSYIEKRSYFVWGAKYNTLLKKISLKTSSLFSTISEHKILVENIH